ncbi:MAG: glycosyltransferase [Solirubrobacterales bacterium]|nr:glycosyltransferase [Solirubrobacterales bacterium]
MPPYGLGASTPKTPLGSLLWWGLSKPIGLGLDQGAREYNDLRCLVGLPPRLGHHSALSQQLVIVATLPQLERGEPFDDRFHVTGPIFWEPDFPDVELPEGDGPLVMVAPSTAQDPDHSLLRASLEGLGGLDARIISTWNRRPLNFAPAVPDNTRLVEWLSYSRTMPMCAVVVSQGGHGTVARTLQAGAVPVIIPFAGDQYENAARVDSAGLGIRLPARLMSPQTLRLAVERALDSSSMRTRCKQTGAWAAEHDGTATAAELILSL